jgi:cbb3-type cytochrome oxidase subunit 3
MWKETVRALQTGAAAEVAIVAFVVAFVLVVIYAFTLKKSTRDEIKRQPLDDAPEFAPRDDA